MASWQQRKREGERDYWSKQNQRRFQNALQQTLDRRKQKSGMENVLRTGGSLVGGFFGGPAGAAVGNLVGGGVFELTNSSHDSMLASGNYGGNVTDSFRQQERDVNRQLESMNKEDNKRHFTEPIKTFGTSMMMAELGTPAKSTGTGADKIVGWDEMTYFDKATRSGKSMVKDAGGWKEVGKNVMSNIGIGTDKVADPEMNNADAEARHALGLGKNYEEGLIESDYSDGKLSLKRSRGGRGGYAGGTGIQGAGGTPDLWDYKHGTNNLFDNKSGDDFAMTWLKQDADDAIANLSDYVGTNQKRLDDYIPIDQKVLNKDHPYSTREKKLDIGTARNAFEDIDTKWKGLEKLNQDFSARNKERLAPHPMPIPDDMMESIISGEGAAGREARLNKVTFDKSNPDTWSSKDMLEFWQNQDFSTHPDLNKNFDDWDNAPLEVIPDESINEIVPDLGFPDPQVTAYGHQDIQIYYNDMLNNGYTPEQAEKELGRWGGEWRHGQTTDRTKRKFGSGHFGENVGKIDSNKSKNIVSLIGDDYNNADFDRLGNRINPLDYGSDPDSSSFVAMVNDKIPNINDPLAFSDNDKVRVDLMTPGKVGNISSMPTQAAANDLFEHINKGGNTDNISVADLYALFQHGQLEGWSKERREKVAKLIEKKIKK